MGGDPTLEPAREGALAAWEREAATLRWTRPFTRLGDPEPGPAARWFVDGELNVAVNCVDRHLEDRASRTALQWEGEPGDRRELTYAELAEEVAATAAGLAQLGVGPGDRVALYLGLVPETVVAMLACARLGAVHGVLSPTLPAEALADRLVDLEPRVLVTQDGSWRGGVVLPLKARADEALAATPGVEHTVVVRRTGIDIAWYEGDRWFHELRDAGAVVRQRDPQAGEPVSLPADAPLSVVYLADRRGAPIGVVHRSAGYLVYASTLHRRALSTGPDDVFWCAVDIGWIAGQTHAVYGPLCAGASTVLFEGTLGTPTRARAWQMIEHYGVNAFVTTPSVARNLRHWVDSPPSQARLDSLRSIVHLGEPIDDETRDWLRRDVGGGRAVVRDGWGQIELGAIVSVEPPTDPPLPDPGFEVVDVRGHPVDAGAVGELTLRHPWPATLLGVRHPDPWVSDRMWKWPGRYATGDRARRERDGRVTVLGRIDPVISVSGQLVSADEVRDVLEEHPLVARAEVVARPDRRSGQVVVACVVLADDAAPPVTGRVARELREHVHDSLGGLARPRAVAFVDELPAGLPRAQLREALAVLCGSSTAEVLVLSSAQVQAAAAAATSRGDE